MKKTINGLKFISHEEVKRRIFKKPGYKEAYDALEPEFAIVRAMIDQRIKHKLTQRELAKKLGIQQSVLARFESRNGNPTFETMQKIASALGLVITVKPVRAS